MKHVALLRGINVGNSVRINMKDLKLLFEKNGFSEVSTYINSGNIVFESSDNKSKIQKDIEAFLLKEYGQGIKALVFNREQIISIANAIPAEWKNDEHQKTDVAYLFDTVNNKEILDILPVKKDYVKLIYTNGAVLWNVNRSNYNKSQLNKIISHKIYKEMTIRNVNTARYLASIM